MPSSPIRSRIVRTFVALLAALALLTTGPFLALAQPRDGDRGSLPHGVTKVVDQEGHTVSAKSLLDSTYETSALLVGEAHDDSIAHRFETWLLERLASRASRPDSRRRLVLSLEMFERDVQGVLDEYLRGFTTAEHLNEAGRAWSNFEAAYLPLLRMCRRKNVPVLAANAPGRYVDLVRREGGDRLTDLPPNSHRWLPPLPLPEPDSDYARAFMSEIHEVADSTAPHDTSGTRGHHHGGSMARLLEAQNLRDASMAHRIAHHLTDHPGDLVYHLSGNFHVRNQQAIAGHLERYRPGTNILTVRIESRTEVDSLPRTPDEGRADLYVITTSED